MKYFFVPKSKKESDQLISLGYRYILGDRNNPRLEDDDLWDACKEFISLAGSFNHHITREHRNIMLDILANLGEEAIDPILTDLVECSRAEQFDITRAFILRLI